MAPRNLWLYRPQILRVVQESLEVSVNLCNTELRQFTTAKIFDIFNQILPTAFVLNTGYWPFFNTLKKESICVCARYALPCRHYKHDHHWIDLDSIQMDNTTAFSTRNGILEIANSEIDVIPVIGDMEGFSLNFKLTFQYKKIERGRPRRKKDEKLNINQQQAVTVAIYSRFNVHNESYPAFYSIMFQPSPFFCDTYGSQFPQLLQILPAELNRRYFTVLLEHMPKFSLILHHVNLPLYIALTTIAVIHSSSDVLKLRRMSCHKSTQTEDRSNLEIWRCKEIIGSLKPIWADLEVSENVTLNHLSFNTALLEGNGQVTPTALSNAVTQTVEQLPFRDNDRDYEVQWPRFGFQKAISKRRRKKKVTSESVDQTQQPTFNENATSCSYAAAVKKCSGRKKKSMENTKSREENIDLQWIERQIPEEKGPLTDEQINEHFEIAEEIIREDLENQQLPDEDCWWNV